MIFLCPVPGPASEEGGTARGSVPGQGREEVGTVRGSAPGQARELLSMPGLARGAEEDRSTMRSTRGEFTLSSLNITIILHGIF